MWYIGAIDMKYEPKEDILTIEHWKELIDLLKIGQKGIIVLSIAIVLDMVTGVIKAIMNHDLQSSEFRN